MSTQTEALRIVIADARTKDAVRALSLVSIHIAEETIHPGEAVIAAARRAARTGDVYSCTLLTLVVYVLGDLVKLYKDEGMPPGEGTFNEAYRRSIKRIMTDTEALDVTRDGGPAAVNIATNSRPPTGVN
jgi:hypothetical protein